MEDLVGVLRRPQYMRALRPLAMPQLRTVCCALVLVVLAFGAEAQIYRCANTDSNVPCPGAKEVDTSPALSWDQAKGSTEALHLCQAFGGGQFCTNQHCRQRDTLVERIKSVPSGAPFEQQGELGRQRLAQSRPGCRCSLNAELPRRGSNDLPAFGSSRLELGVHHSSNSSGRFSSKLEFPR